MNIVAQFLAPSDVLLDLDAADKQALFEAVGRLCEAHHGMAAVLVANSLNERENLGSTGLGQGVAIPHARIKGLAQAIAAFARPKVPLEFDSPDGKPVAYFFMLLVPEEATEKHLQILADVAQLFADPKFCSRLGTSKDRDEVRQLFAESPGPTNGKKA
jgi:PTS system nitrogen regulatory IIA component